MFIFNFMLQILVDTTTEALSFPTKKFSKPDVIKLNKENLILHVSVYQIKIKHPSILIKPTTTHSPN